MPQLPDLSGLVPLLQLFVAFIGAYFLAVWVSLIVWTFRDVRSRTRDIFAIFLAISLVAVFNVAGLILYFILRPRETLAERYERELAEEALLQDIEERQECPVCHPKNVRADYLVCPRCHTKLRKKCENCGRVINQSWNVCPYCGESQTVTSASISKAPPPPRLHQTPPAATPSEPAQSFTSAKTETRTG
ncbi:MAG TPA: zinc ribbon domain-containing protein [Anaerolineae bacterium]